MKHLITLSIFAIIASVQITNAMERNDLDLNTELAKAAGSGNIKQVKTLIEQGADVNALQVGYRYCATPLYIAMDKGQWQVLQFLMAQGARPDCAIGPGNNTPLHMANWLGSVHEYLLDNGASTEKRNAKGQTPLHCAVRNCRSDLVKLFCERGACIDAQDLEKNTPFHTAVLQDFFHSTLIKLRIVPQLLHAVVFKDTHSTKGLITAFSYFSKKCLLLYKQRYNLLLPHLQDQLSFQALMRMLKAENQYAKPFALQALKKQLPARGEKLKQLLQIQNTSGLTAYNQIDNYTLKKTRLLNPETVESDLKEFLTALHEGETKTVSDNNIFKAAYDMIPKKHC